MGNLATVRVWLHYHITFPEMLDILSKISYCIFLLTLQTREEEQYSTFSIGRLGLVPINFADFSSF